MSSSSNLPTWYISALPKRTPLGFNVPSLKWESTCLTTIYLSISWASHQYEVSSYRPASEHPDSAGVWVYQTEITVRPDTWKTTQDSLAKESNWKIWFTCTKRTKHLSYYIISSKISGAVHIQGGAAGGRGSTPPARILGGATGNTRVVSNPA